MTHTRVFHEEIKSCFRLLSDKEIRDEVKLEEFESNKSLNTIESCLGMNYELGCVLRNRALDVAMLVLHRGTSRKELLNRALNICQLLTRAYKFPGKYQRKLVKLLHKVSVTLLDDDKRILYYHHFLAIASILQNLIIGYGSEPMNILSHLPQVQQIFSILLICENKFKHEEFVPRLLKTILLCWPEQHMNPLEFQCPNSVPGNAVSPFEGEVPAVLSEADVVVPRLQQAERDLESSPKATDSNVIVKKDQDGGLSERVNPGVADIAIGMKANNSWAGNQLRMFVRLAIEVLESGAYATSGSGPSFLNYSIVAAMSIDHELVLDEFSKFHFRAQWSNADYERKTYEDLVADYLETWVRMMNEPFRDIDDTIISCRMLIKIMSLDGASRPKVFERFGAGVLPKTVRLFDKLVTRYKNLFPPDVMSRSRCERIRLKPCDRMLYRFLSEQNCNQSWRKNLFNSVNDKEHERLSKLLESAGAKTLKVRTSNSTVEFLEPMDTQQAALWTEMLKVAMIKAEAKQMVSFGCHFKPNNVYESTDQSIVEGCVQ